jgi:hypothetical protein
MAAAHKKVVRQSKDETPKDYYSDVGNALTPEKQFLSGFGPTGRDVFVVHADILLSESPKKTLRLRS